MRDSGNGRLRGKREEREREEQGRLRLASEIVLNSAVGYAGMGKAQTRGLRSILSSRIQIQINHYMLRVRIRSF